MLRTYAEFLSYAEECGVMVFAGKFAEGFPNLYELTAPSRGIPATRRQTRGNGGTGLLLTSAWPSGI